MALGMYAASVPVFQRQLGALSKVLEKGSAWAAAKKVERDWVAQAKKITDHGEMQRLWTAARAGGASGAELEEIANLGQQLKDKQEKTEEKTEEKSDAN